MAVVFLPEPKQVGQGKPVFALPAQGSIGIAEHALFPVAQMAGRMLKGAPVNVRVPGITDTLSLALVKGMNRDGYRLRVTPRGIRIEAESVVGARHGMHTLAQVVVQCPGGCLPALDVHDWPDFVDRGIYYDVCRGRVPKLEWLLRMAECLARFKINHLQLYIEHTFAFRRHPDIGKDASPLAAEDILRLDAHCRELGIELVPSLASLGHLATVLKHPQYRHLAEDWGVGRFVDPDACNRKPVPGMYGWTLSPANPRIYDFLDALFAEFLPVFSSRRFNVCCDEAWDLGWGQSYRLCRKLGKGRVYLNHILKLRQMAAKYGKTIMFWGDIIRQHPELIPEIPKDVTVLDWGYPWDHNFDAIRDFRKVGLPFFACPGTSSWISLFPRLPNAMANIAGFARAGHRHGAGGLLTTDWGDGGHYNFMEYSWYGYLTGAEQGWNTGADLGSFPERFCRLFLRSGDKALIRAVEDLGDIASLNVPSDHYECLWQYLFFATARNWQNVMGKHDALLSEGGKLRHSPVTVNAALGRRTLAKLDHVRVALAAHQGCKGEDPTGVLPYWVFAVDTLRHAARKLAALGPGGTPTPAALRRLRREMVRLRARFVRLWLARNRPSEIRTTLARYREVIRAYGRWNAGIRALTPFISRILVSRRQPSAGKLDRLELPQDWQALKLEVRDFPAGFCDLHPDVFAAADDAMAWFVGTLECAEPMRLRAWLGYDGPVKMWVDGKLRFHDPKGTNPAGKDAVNVPLSVGPGRHPVVLALGSNEGRAWGLYLRFERCGLPRRRLVAGEKAWGLPAFKAGR